MKKEKNRDSAIIKSQMMDALMKHITDSIYFKGLDSKFIRINKACSEKFKMAGPDEAIGKTDFDIFTEEHARQAYEDEQKIIRTGKPIVNIEEKETWNSDENRWASTTKMPFYNEKNEIIGTFGISRDITDKKKSEEELKESRSKIRAILHSSIDGIYATDKKGKILMHNSKFIELWKIPARLINLESDDKILNFITNQLLEPKQFVNRLRKIYNSKENCVDVIKLKDGKILERSSGPLKQDAKIIGRVWTFRDITEQKRAEEKIWYLSFHDKLTGLYNRAFFEEELKRLNTERQLPLSIIFCDVNGLKSINDNYGYDKGDLLLCKVSEALRSCFRNEDMVVRWGGDEFIIVLPNTNEEDTDDIVGRICQNCQKKSKPRLPVSIAIGTALKKKVSQDIDLIVNEAEKRMLMNKRAMKAKT